MRTIIYFLSTSLLSSLVGLAFTVAIHPGSPKVKAVLGGAAVRQLVRALFTESEKRADVLAGI